MKPIQSHVGFTANSDIDCVFRHVGQGPIADAQSSAVSKDRHGGVLNRVLWIAVGYISNSPATVAADIAMSLRPICCRSRDFITLRRSKTPWPQR
jgi:hypothetical protein